MRAPHKNTTLTAVVVLILCVGAVVVWRAKATTTVQAGYDEFQTPANATSFEYWNLPGGFFHNANGSSSNPVSATLTLKGGDPVPGFSTDTVIERQESVDVPGTTPLQVTGLRLISARPIRVTFQDGSTVYYNVSVKESSRERSTGSMDFYADNTFTNTLFINREYACSAAGQPTQEFDSTDLGWAPINLSGGGTWSVDPGLSMSTAAAHGVTIRPRTERDILVQHGLVPPTPSPTPSPSPSPSATPIGKQPVLDKAK
jgi:hypothetical protein